MKRINIYITDQQVKEIDKIKKVAEMSLSDIIRRALDEYIDKMKAKYNIK